MAGDKKYELKVNVSAETDLEEAKKKLIELIDLKGKLEGRVDLLKDSDTKGLADLILKTDELTESTKKQKLIIDDLEKAKLRLAKSQQDEAVELQKLNLLTKEQNQANKEAAKQALGLTTEYDRLSKQLNENRKKVKDLRLSNRELSESEKQLINDTEALDKQLKQVDASVGQYQRNVGNYSGALKTLEAASEEVRQKIEQLTKTAGADDKQIESLRKEYEILQQVVNNQSHGFVTMTQEIKANQKAIEQLTKIYGEDSEIVRRLIKENGQLKDTFDDLKATQKAVGSDTFVFDGLLQAGQALTGVYSAATGAAVIFGEENEDLQKQMVKLQAAIALVEGVQATVNALQKEGALVQLLISARTKAAAAAQTLYTFATGGATVATNAFRVALLATGIGAIVVLLGSLASAMFAASDATDAETDSINELNEAFDKSLESTKKITNANELARNSREGGLDVLKRELAILKAKGASETDIFKKEQEIRQAELLNLRVQADAIVDLYEKKQKYGELTIEAEKKINDEIAKLNKEGADKRNEIEAATLQFKRDQTEKAIKLNKEQFDEAIKEAERLQEEAQRLEEIDIRKAKERQLAAIQRIKDSKDTEIAITEESLIVLSEKEEKKRIELEKRLLDQKIDRIYYERDIELSNLKLTEEAKALIIQNAELDIAKLRKDASQKEKERRQSDLNQTVQDVDKAVSLIGDALDKRSQKNLDNISKEQQAQEDSLSLQQSRAEKGLENTLEFEQRKAAELEAAKQKELKKQQRRQKIETFYNLLSGYAKQDASTALTKAAKDIAISEAISIAFAEKGGIAGEVKDRTILEGGSLSKSHSSGDVLMALSPNEGILNERQMVALGGKEGFYNLQKMLDNPINDDVLFPAVPKFSAVVMKNDNAELLREIKDLKQIIKDKPVSSANITSVGDVITTTFQDGKRHILKVVSQKPRFRR